MIFLDANFIIAYSVKNHDYYDRACELWEAFENKDKIILYFNNFINIILL